MSAPGQMQRTVRARLGQIGAAMVLMIAASMLETGVAASAPPKHPQPADYAVLGPDFGRLAADRQEGAPIIARARAVLSREPSPRPIRIEGVSSGRVRAPGVAGPAQADANDVAASMESLRDMDIMLDLALAWRLTGDRAFLNKSGQYLDAWASTYQITFNPVDEGRFDGLILAYDLTETDLPPKLRAKVDAFLRRFATGYVEAMESGDVPIKPTLTNNWQSHRIKLAALAAFQIGDTGLIDRAHALFDKHLDANLREDGSTLDFAQRDALHYVTFSLNSQLMAALAAQAHGQDWYGDRTLIGRALPDTLAWLGPFASGQQTHIEFVKSVVPYDRQRAEAGGKMFQNRPWDPATSARTYLIAALLDPRWKSLSRSLQERALRSTEDMEPGERLDWLSIFARDHQAPPRRPAAAKP
jgi:hypothetical protein